MIDPKPLTAPDIEPETVTRTETAPKNNRCRICKSPRPERAPKPGNVCCSFCSARKNAYKAKLRGIRRCKACNDRPAEPRRKYCTACSAAADEERLLRQRAEYRMRVGKPVDAPLGKMRDRRGQCSRCTAGVMPGKDVCASHARTLEELKAERPVVYWLGNEEAVG